MKSNLLDYIESNFYIDVVSYSLLSELYDCVNGIWCGYDVYTYKGNKYKVKAFIKDYIQRLNNCRIDITMDELIENEIIGELI